ncbi:class I SAM-dependent methyltransferase [Streptomyces microflavus]|uniref:class I SAM-dependent methyltransferase n=1 Tax=Streptomyces microflavus TaxID=1919 RepID=UPI0033E85587
MTGVAGGLGMTGGPDVPTPFDRAERRIWSGRAEACARTYAHPVEALLDAAGVGPGARILDVGCGSGTVSAAAAARGADVYAADAEPGMVEATRRAVPGAGVRVARLPELPYEDSNFDAVLANFALNHVGRPLTARTGLRRITRPGGRGAVTIWRVPAALLGAVERSEVFWQHLSGAEEWWAGAEQGIGATGQV